VPPRNSFSSVESFRGLAEDRERVPPGPRATLGEEDALAEEAVQVVMDGLAGDSELGGREGHEIGRVSLDLIDEEVTQRP